MKAISGKAWMDHLQAEARDNFKNHQLTEVGPGHWRIKRPNEGTYWADIVVMAKAAISVWGDIDACVFAYYSGNEPYENVIAWMAGADAGYYGRQKAAIGMGNIGVDQYVDEVAVYDLRERLAQAPSEYGEEGWEKHEEKFTEAINNAIENVGGMNIETVQTCLLEDLRGTDDDAWEWVGSIGRVTSVRVIYALAAIARLYELLQAKEKAA